MATSRTMEFNLANLGPHVRSYLLQGDQVNAQPIRINWAHNVLDSDGIIRPRPAVVPALAVKPTVGAIMNIAADSINNDNNKSNTVVDSHCFPAFNATKPFNQEERPGFVEITLASGTKYEVQINKLVHVSAYFKAAMAGPFTEAGTHQFEMHDDVTDDAFALLMRWVYTADIHGSVNFTVGMTGPEIFPEPNLNIVLLVQTWILADYFGMPGLQNHLVDFIIRYAGVRDGNFNTTGFFPAVELAWDGTCQGSQLRNLFRDMLSVYNILTREGPTIFARLPTDLVVECAQTMAQKLIDMENKRKMMQNDLIISGPVFEERARLGAEYVRRPYRNAEIMARDYFVHDPNGNYSVISASLFPLPI